MHRIVIILLASLLVAAPTVAGAGYLKIGDIKGESVDRSTDSGTATTGGHVDEIDIHSWSVHVEPGRSGDLVVVRELDKSSPALLQASADGRAMPSFTVGHTGRDGTSYLVITMEDVRVSSYSVSGAGDERPTEEVAFYYNKIAFHYQDGDAAGDTRTITFTGLE